MLNDSVFDVWTVAVGRGSVPSSSVKRVEYICCNSDKEIEHLGLPARDTVSLGEFFSPKETPTGVLYYSKLVIYTNKPFVSNLVWYC